MTAAALVTVFFCFCCINIDNQHLPNRWDLLPVLSTSFFPPAFFVCITLPYILSFESSRRPVSILFYLRPLLASKEESCQVDSCIWALATECLPCEAAERRRSGDHARIHLARLQVICFRPHQRWCEPISVLRGTTGSYGCDFGCAYGERHPWK